MVNQKLNLEINKLNKEINKIKTRNQRVELDKAWETSWTRKICIAFFTYLTIGIFMNAMTISKPWLNAIVPTLGFVLSTFSLPIIRKYWVKKYTSNK